MILADTAATSGPRSARPVQRSSLPPAPSSSATTTHLLPRTQTPTAPSLLAPIATTTHHRRQPLPCLRAAPTETAQQVLLEPPTQRDNDDDDDDGQEGGAPEAAGPGPRSATGPQVSFVSLVDGKYTVRGRLVLPVPASRVYELLTDYGGCDRVFGNIAASEVLRSEEGGLQVVQSCRWKFLAFSGTFKVHLGVTEDPASGTLLFSLVQSNFMRDFEGRWAVRPARAAASAAATSAGVYACGDGARVGSEWCEVEHQLSVVPSVPVPAPVSYYTRSIFVWQVEGILADLQRAVLADAAAAL